MQACPAWDEEGGEGLEQREPGKEVLKRAEHAPAEGPLRVRTRTSFNSHEGSAN